jgi:hypothetical protein
MQTKEPTNPPEKTPGDPCPECGCPYPGDHTQDCQRGKRKEWESLDNKQLLLALDAFSDFLGELNDAIGKLRKNFEQNHGHRR